MNHLHHENSIPDGMSDRQLSPDSHCARCGQDLSYAAYIIGGALLLGAIIVSATMYYSVKTAFKPLTGGSVAAVQQPSATAPSAPSQPTAPAPTGAPVNVTLKPNVPFLGNANAKVTVVEYADYQCPFCERWYTQTWPELKSKYVDTGKIKFVYQDFAFLGPDSNTLAEGAHCAADQNKFWQYHDYIFSHQGTENTGWATADKVKTLAQSVSGLNSSQFNSCLDSGKYKQEVLDETAAGKNYGVSGTPTLFVNGTAIVGAQPASAFEQAIDAALAK